MKHIYYKSKISDLNSLNRFECNNCFHRQDTCLKPYYFEEIVLMKIFNVNMFTIVTTRKSCEEGNKIRQIVSNFH